jgi:hypothetical protein
MNRREFVSVASLTAVAADAAPQSAGATADFRYVERKAGVHPFRVRESGQRPHIFFVCLDMVSPDHYLPTRRLQREMEMPTLRGLMADGVTFTNAFCTVPVCSPSRASFYTGRYPYVLAIPGSGPDGQADSLRPTDVIYPEYLKASGYRTKHVGKNHTSAQKFVDAFDEIDTNWNNGMPSLGSDENYHAYLQRLGIKLSRYARSIWRLDPDRKTRSRNYGGWIEQGDGKPFPHEGQYSSYLCDWAIQKTREAVSQPGRRLYLQLKHLRSPQPIHDS